MAHSASLRSADEPTALHFCLSQKIWRFLFEKDSRIWLDKDSRTPRNETSRFLLQENLHPRARGWPTVADEAPLEDVPTPASPSEPGPEWSAANLPPEDIGRILVTTGAIKFAGDLNRNAVIGFRLQFRRRKQTRGEDWEFVEFPDDLSQKHDHTRTLQEAHFKAAIYAIQTLTETRPDLVGKVQVEFHTEHWEVSRVMMNKGLNSLSQTNKTWRIQLATLVRPYRPGKNILGESWGTIRRKDKGGEPYRKQFSRIHSRLKRLAYGEGTGGKRFMVNVYDLGEMLKHPVLKHCSTRELLCYHVVRQRNRKVTALARALGLKPKDVHNAVNRVDRKLKGRKTSAAREPVAPTPGRPSPTT